MANSDPIKLFKKWFDAAVRAELNEPNAMTLATATPGGKPSARMVLLKGFDERGFVFYTNYNSRKGRELGQNPHAALVLFWQPLERQIRITGRVTKVSPEESDLYFLSRPLGSRFSASISKQSSVIASRAVLLQKLKKIEQKYPLGNPPRPIHWGGYRVHPNEIEFWQGGKFRLHDRLRYCLRRDGSWSLDRLSPYANAADTDLAHMLKGVEDRYNRTQTLQVAFAETYTNHGRKHTENGELFLRKPGRMRWEYKIPAGKIFGSDGKFLYSFQPDKNLFEKASMKGAEDMRAPLAFLLGKLQFDKEFSKYRTGPDGRGSTFITGTPKSDKLPYSEVTFLVDPDFTIRWLNVKGVDGSQLDFAFSAEKRNPPIAESMFKFAPRPGVIFSDVSQNP